MMEEISHKNLLTKETESVSSKEGYSGRQSSIIQKARASLSPSSNRLPFLKSRRNVLHLAYETKVQRKRPKIIIPKENVHIKRIETPVLRFSNFKNNQNAGLQKAGRRGKSLNLKRYKSSKFVPTTIYLSHLKGKNFV